MYEATPVLRPDALPPGTEVGHWRVVDRLGVGGYGAAYRVEDIHHPGVILALKLALRPGEARAGREVVLLMEKAVHPNVVRIHGHGRWPDPVEGHTYYVMDLVPGLPLDVCAETRNPSFLRLAGAGAKMARALGELHARGVVHRDVKPENILIREPDGEPVLVDFGIGVYEGASSLTPTSLPPGTAHLRSPEAMRFWMQRGQHSGEPYQVSAADDLYALGVSLYRAVTGHYPFNPELPSDFLAVAIAHHRAHAPRDFNRRVPRVLSDVLLRMLAKDPKERYRDGAEVHEALMAAAAFGKRGEWEASLFEWEPGPAAREGEAPGRRIRRPAFPTRPPTATGPRFMLLASDPSTARRRRGQRAGEPMPIPGSRGRGRALQREGLAVTLGLGLALAGVWAANRHSSESPSPPALARSTPSPTERIPPGSGEVAQALELPDAGSAAAPLPLESTPAAASPRKARATKGAPLKKLPQTTPGEPPQQSPVSPGRALGTTALCVSLACAGAQVRPAEMDCPAESQAAMKALDQVWGVGPNVAIDMHQDMAMLGQPPIFRSGPITSKVEEGFGRLTEGTLLFGELFTEGTNVYGRYDRAQTPDGKTYPVCFTLGNNDEDGIEKLPGPQPGTVHTNRWARVTAVKRFVFKEPPAPKK